MVKDWTEFKFGGGTRLGPTGEGAPMPHPRLDPFTAIVLTAIVSPPFSRSFTVTDDLHIDDPNMTAIGSVFLGDVQRHRHLSSSTPPSSPPPAHPGHPTLNISELDDADEQQPPEVKPPSISPALSLELRLRWLETLLFGAKHDEPRAKPEAKVDKLKDGETLTRRTEDLQRGLDSVAQSNDALKRFMDRCELSLSPSGLYVRNSWYISPRPPWRARLIRIWAKWPLNSWRQFLDCLRTWFHLFTYGLSLGLLVPDS